MNRIALTGALTALALLPEPSRALTLSESDIEAIGRVVFAEAGNQPVAGKVAVLDTILNRVAAGRFGADVQSVIEQRNAFEPVTRAGGWRRLPALTASQRAELITILALKAGGHLGDLSGGALYFQNPAVVASRAAAGTVRPQLVGFGGMPQTAVIGQHTFYRPGAGGGAPGMTTTTVTAPRKALRSSFVGEDLTATEEGEGETTLVLPALPLVEDVAAAR
jgi:spore germination cell wall hydrolase CwlJ-like protein